MPTARPSPADRSAPALSSLMPQEHFEGAARMVREAVPCERFVIGTVNPETKDRIYLAIDSDIKLGEHVADSRSVGEWLWREVYETKNPRHEPDLRAATFPEAPRLAAAGLRSALIVPIVQGGRCQAHLVVFSTRPRAFTKEHEDLLLSIAGQLAAAVPDFRTARRMAASSIRLRVLHDLMQTMSRSLSAAQALDRCARAMVELLDAELSRIFLLDEKEQVYRLHATYSRLSGPLPAKDTYRPGEGILGTVAAEGKGVTIPDVQDDARTAEAGWVRAGGIRSLLLQPIFSGSEVMGVVSCASRERNHFTQEDQDFVEALISQAVAAVENGRLHEKVKRSEVFLRGFVENNADAIIATDADGRIILWNPAAERLFGYAEGEITGRHVEVLIPPERFSSWEREIAEPLRRGSLPWVPVLEEERVRKDGSRIPLSISISPVKDDAGGVIAISAVYRDLTERRRAEEERERHVKLLHTLNILARKISSSLDVKEVLDYVVLSAAELLGTHYVACYLKEGDKLVLHSEHDESIPSQNLPELRIGEGLGGAVAATGEVLYVPEVLKDPRWKSVEWARREGIGSYWGIPLRKNDTVKGILSAVTRGVRPPRPGELALLEMFGSHAAIAMENAESHALLRQALEYLREGQERLVRTEKLSSIGVLAAGAAHEILNPATIIGLRAQRLKDQAGDGQVAQAADIILENVDRIARICEDLRRFSRDEKPSLRPFELGSVIRHTTSLLGHEFRLGSVAVECELGDEPVVIRGDANQMQQVFVNLFTNAIDAMPEGGTLAINGRKIENEKARWWEIRVADTGQGIPEDVMSRIFDPFFTTKPQHKGTGLGLSVSLGLVEGHGGTIFAESGPGWGATFIIRLPAFEEPR